MGRGDLAVGRVICVVVPVVDETVDSHRARWSHDDGRMRYPLFEGGMYRPGMREELCGDVVVRIRVHGTPVLVLTRPGSEEVLRRLHWVV
jgi:hypothetical protein